jgi:Icc-related predicted phosphoesterase
MKLAFFGDIHGQILHMLATALLWQHKAGEPLDYIIQVGDFGAFPTLESIQKDKAAWRFAQHNPAELDFGRVLDLTEGRLADSLKLARQQLKRPVYFIRGNHDDVEWLEAAGKRPELTANHSWAVDPFDLFHYLPDGRILQLGDVTIGFLGGIENPEQRPQDVFNEAAYQTLFALPPGTLDILVTHEPPYGVSTGFRGQVQGSPKISALIQTIVPRYLIAGYLHHIIGPRQFGRTTYLGLNVLFNARSERHQVEPGSMVILDTIHNTLELVTDDWLSQVPLDFSFENWQTDLT